MARTLLPVFNEFKILNGVDIKEKPETFVWMKMPDRYDFEMAACALDDMPGSREWLKAYTFDEDSDGHPFDSSFGPKLLIEFGSHHSGSSVTNLAWRYKQALNNWDRFVYNVKESYLKALYKSQQLGKEDLAYSLNFSSFKKLYNIPYDDDTTKAMISALNLEILADTWAAQDNAKAQRISGQVNVLKHHYAFPDRWFDGIGGSSLFGSPEDISPEILAEMTAIYSDYPFHLKKVLEAYTANLVLVKNRPHITPSEAAELEAWVDEAKTRLFDPPDLMESIKLTKARIDSITESRASYKSRAH